MFVCLCVPIGSIHITQRLSIVFHTELNNIQVSKFSEIRKKKISLMISPFALERYKSVTSSAIH